MSNNDLKWREVWSLLYAFEQGWITHEQCFDKLKQKLGAETKSPAHAEFENLEWVRKPTSLGEVNTTVDGNTINQFNFAAYDLVGDGSLYNYECESHPQYFILRHNGNRYFVDTQGFNYPRYVIRIV